MKNKVLMVGLGLTTAAIGLTACGPEKTKTEDQMVLSELQQEENIENNTNKTDEEQTSQEVSSVIKDAAEEAADAAVDAKESSKKEKEKNEDKLKKEENLSKKNDKEEKNDDINESSISDDTDAQPEESKELEGTEAFMEEIEPDDTDDEGELIEKIKVDIEHNLYLYGCPMSSSTLAKISEAESFNEEVSEVTIV